MGGTTVIPWVGRKPTGLLSPLVVGPLSLRNGAELFSVADILEDVCVESTKLARMAVVEDYVC